jgi:hypothetical protein
VADHQYRKKPVVIEAFQYNGKMPGHTVPEWFYQAISEGKVRLYGHLHDGRCSVDIKTLEGTMTADPGDWIIQGLKGELYPCKPEIFKMTYEKVQP